MQQQKCICKGMTPQFPPPSVSSCFGVALGREDPSLWILVQGTLPVSTRVMWKILPGPQQPRFVGFSRNDGWRTRRLGCKHVHEVKNVGCEGLWSNTCATICNTSIYTQIMTSWHPSYSLFDMPIVFCWGFKYYFQHICQCTSTTSHICCWLGGH